MAAKALKDCGIFDKLGEWTYSFMSTRAQTVIANNEISSKVNVQSGLVQGSCLGPLIFLLIVETLSNIEMNADKGLLLMMQELEEGFLIIHQHNPIKRILQNYIPGPKNTTLYLMIVSINH